MKSEREIFTTALAIWGEDLQLKMLVEECAELIQAVMKLHRSKGCKGSYIQVWEEMADVEIMIDQLRLHFDDSLIDSQRKKKMERLEARLTEKLSTMRDWPVAWMWFETVEHEHVWDKDNKCGLCRVEKNART